MEFYEQQTRHEEPQTQSLLKIPLLFVAHVVLALAAWSVLMAAGYALQPNLSQTLILALSFLVPFVAGFGINRFRQNVLATTVWIFGLAWFFIVVLWVLDMPTGPGQCYQCDATEKLSRTFFSIPGPGGLMDNDGPFLATWPVAAMFGYSIGARLSMKKSEEE
jgi:hypothetical protein